MAHSLRLTRFASGRRGGEGGRQGREEWTRGEGTLSSRHSCGRFRCRPASPGQIQNISRPVAGRFPAVSPDLLADCCSASIFCPLVTDTAGRPGLQKIISPLSAAVNLTLSATLAAADAGTIAAATATKVPSEDVTTPPAAGVAAACAAPVLSTAGFQTAGPAAARALPPPSQRYRGGACALLSARVVQAAAAALP